MHILMRLGSSVHRRYEFESKDIEYIVRSWKQFEVARRAEGMTAQKVRDCSHVFRVMGRKEVPLRMMMQNYRERFSYDDMLSQLAVSGW